MKVAKPTSRPLAAGTRRVTSQSGSTLVWVMVVILVMVVVLGIGLTAVSGRLNLSVVRHEEHQAYYTALSSTETVAAWIMDGEDVAAVDLLLERIADMPEGITMEENGLPSEVGTCTVNLRWANDEQTILKITSTATLAERSETVSLTLTYTAQTPQGYAGELQVSHYDVSQYVASAKTLNELSIGTPIRIGDRVTTNNSSANNDDLDTLNVDTRDKKGVVVQEAIKSVNSDREAWWTHTNDSGTPAGDTTVLGTQTFPLNSSGGTTTDSRRFVTPINGRLLVNPLERAEFSTDNGHANMLSISEYTNTKLSSLAIDTSNSQNRNIKLRLAEMNATDTQRKNARRLNALLMLTFTDYTGEAETATDGAGNTYTWHPNDWDSLDIYLRSDAGLDTNILIGPFGHKYDEFMDTYWSWGDYKDDYHGTTKGEFGKLWSYVSSKAHFDNYGIPMFPADYGNTHFWVLDGTKDILYPSDGNTTPKYFRILQGVNIFDGSIYSNRSTIIGGGLIKRTTYGRTTDNVNSSVDGFGEQDYNDYAAVYIEGTLRYSQIIENTDIILMPPSEGTVSSTIRRPDTWRDRIYRKDAIPAKDKEFDPTMTIKGGTIYVGSGQALTIQGATLNNMWISPDEIVVAQGGSLIIESSAHTNVLTNIFVDGGSLTINAGAKIKGNIYAYNNGTVNIKGAFTLDSPSALALEREHDGLLIFGESTVGAVFNKTNNNNEILSSITITAPGKLTVPSTLPIISGNSGRVHLVGGTWAGLVTGSTSVGSATSFLCNGYNPITGTCQHFDGILNYGPDQRWAIGTFGKD